MNLITARILDTLLAPIIWVLFFVKQIKQKKRIKTKSPKKILIIRLFGFGNIILISPLIKALKKKFPKSNFFLLTVDRNKGIPELFKYDKITYIKTKNLFSTVFSIMKFILSNRRKFDLVIDLEPFARSSAILTFMLSPKESWGIMVSSHNRNLYDKTIEYFPNEHISQFYLRFIHPNPKKPKLPHVSLTKGTIKVVEELGLPKKFVILHPGTSENVPQRRWPPERYAVVGDWLIENCGFSIVLTGSKAEKELCDSIIKHAKHKKDFINLAGKITLKYLPAIVKMAKLVICPDTGIAHIAALMETPLIAIYGPNSPKLYGPLMKNNKGVVVYKNLPCSPCMTNLNKKKGGCNNPVCILNITAVEIISKIKQIIKNA